MTKEERAARNYHLKRKVKAMIRASYSWPAKPIFQTMMRLPPPVVWIISEVSGTLFWIFGFKLRKLAIKNLRLVYKNTLPEQELKAIAKESMTNVLKTFLEGPLIVRHQMKIVNDVTIEGEDYINEALKKGNGVLALGSHTGNFLLMLTTLTLKGYPISFVFKEPSDKGFSEHFWKLMKGLNLNPIPVKPRSVATKRSLKTLKNKEILWLATDQNVREGSMGVEFFGTKAATAKGPAVLALWSGAEILPMTIKRIGWLKHKIIIKKPFILKETGNKEGDIYNSLKIINGVIEQMILDNPREWWWIHNRWKQSHKYQ